ncbi:MAG: UDP-2,3-diacylglucosamine diphosphatase [Maritimibacter sp.]|nr:UDP-2,3-diacylglucosamine diphosphatase [Maritimibacter sp.]
MSHARPEIAPPIPAPPAAARGVRSVFLSDLHLGARAGRPGPILAFLRRLDAERLYLVGDILDTFHGGKLHWGPTEDAILGEIERLARTGTEVTYLPGNHDAPLRAPGAVPPLAGVRMREALIHRGADGRRHLVLHGDQCDRRMMRWHVMTRLGSRADAALRRLDESLRRHAGLAPDTRSPFGALQATANALMNLGDRFERRLTALAAAAGADGVICGHSHKPVLKEVDGIAYANCGDWVDSFTALVEHHDGRMALIAVAPEAAPRPASAGTAQGAGGFGAERPA